MALARLGRALDEYRIAGIRTNLPFHQKLVTQPDFVAGRYDTGFIAEHERELTSAAVHGADDRLAVALAVATATTEARQHAKSESGAACISPWLSAHRAGLFRKR
jgi:acetyl-CoA carboxylase biotin carboxylase subunit